MNRGLAEDLAAELEAVALGDMEAMRRLHDATCHKLFAVCLSIVNDREASQDVLQEVYIKVWNRAQGFDRARGLPLAWLAMMARNSAIDWLRAQSRQRRTSEQVALELISDDGEPVDEQLARQQQAAQAINSMEELDTASHAMIHDAFIGGLSYSEVAESRGMPLGTVKSRIRRGLLQMRQSMVSD